MIKRTLQSITKSLLNPTEWRQWFIARCNVGRSQLKTAKSRPIESGLRWVCLWKLHDETVWQRERHMKSESKTEMWRERRVKPNTSFSPKHHISGYIPLLVSQRDERLETRETQQGRRHWIPLRLLESIQNGDEDGARREIKKHFTYWKREPRCSMLPHTHPRPRPNTLGVKLQHRFATEIERSSSLALEKVQ